MVVYTIYKRQRESNFMRMSHVGCILCIALVCSNALRVHACVRTCVRACVDACVDACMRAWQRSQLSPRSRSMASSSYARAHARSLARMRTCMHTRIFASMHACALVQIFNPGSTCTYSKAHPYTYTVGYVLAKVGHNYKGP